MSLGCARHKAYVYDRGGMTRIGFLGNIEQVQWTRVRDDISSASVFVKEISVECARTLGEISGGRHELVLFRDDQRVWEGPITRLAFQGTSVQVYARDIAHYLYRTVMRAEYNNSGALADYALNRVEGIIRAELARKEALSPPINVLPYLDFRVNAGDARTARWTKQRQSTVWEDMDSLAHRGGIDYTVLGRSLIAFDTHNNLGITPVLTEKDFLGEVIVTEYAMDLVTEATVTDGKGGFGKAGGLDPYYGWVEVLHTAYDESEGLDPPSHAEMTSQAQRNLAGRNPSPMEVRVPDGSSLNPAGALTMDHLVPGVVMPLRATMAGRDVSQLQKLNRLQVLESPAGESLRVTMTPAALEDAEGEGD